MNSAAILFLFILVAAVLGQKDNHSTDSATEITSVNPTGTTSSLSDSSVELLDEGTGPSNQTDLDTSGDTRITNEPHRTENNTEDITDEQSTVTSLFQTSTKTTIHTTTLTADIPWEACSSNPCQNGGLCQEDSTHPSVYSCNCTEGFVGLHCQVHDLCVFGEEGTLCSGGACVYDNGGQSRSCGCFFGKFWDNDKKECSNSLSPCFPNPCLNGGSCSDQEDVFGCACAEGHEGEVCDIRNECGDRCANGACVFVEERRLKYCQCHQGFYWNENSQSCQNIVLPCLPNPCRNNASCSAVSAAVFNCSCAEGYEGPTCSIRNYCNEIDGDHLFCENGACIDVQTFKICRCDEGFYLDETSYTCKKAIKPCVPNPCSNGGMCVPISSSDYNCTCSEGHVGPRCKEPDFCALKGGTSFCGNADCRNDRHLELFYCACPGGQYFDHVTRACYDVDFCPLIQCGENQVCTNNSCKCKENYRLDNSTGKCKPHICTSRPCPVEDMICSEGNGIGNYECGCKDGASFNGTHCNDGASCVFPNLNDCEQICAASENKYTCRCLEGHFALEEDNKTCTYIGNTTCTNKTCEKGSCMILEEMETCVCGPGFVEVDGKCLDLCSAGVLPEGFCPDNQCEPIASGFRCKCEGKYILSEDRTTCTVRKMCQQSEIDWSTCGSRNAICKEDWNRTEGYRCECSRGQVERKGGLCWDVCNIRENQRKCSAFGAECSVDDKGEATCRCPPLFIPFGNGETCSQPAAHSYLLTLPVNATHYKDKQTDARGRITTEGLSQLNYRQKQKDVQNAFRVMFPELLHVNILKCKEQKDYLDCKVEMQFSSMTEGGFKRLKLPGVCQTSSYSPPTCLMPPSLLLQKNLLESVVTIRKTDPCDVIIKENLCGSETLCTSSLERSAFNCTCKPGFDIRSTWYPFTNTDTFIQNCKDIDECSEVNACPKNMECRNTIGSYTCSCMPGYRPQDDGDGCVSVCKPSPCVHGLCEQSGDHGFECCCDAGYSGMLCNLQDENFKHARMNIIIVGAVLGGALLVTIIISYACISKLKKKKYADGPEQMLYATEMTERRNVDSGAINNAFRRD